MRRAIHPRATLVATAATALLVAGCGSTVQTAQAPLSSGAGVGTTNGPAPAGGSNLSVPAGGNAAAVSGTPGFVAGGGLSSSSTTGASATTGGTSATTGSAPAVPAASKGPIQLGFIVTNTSNAGSLGINAGQTYTDKQLYNALVAAMNKSGGINGRKIQPVYGVTDTASANWNSDFQAACAKFTQDNHVAAVLGYIFVFLDSFESCLAKAGVPHLYGGYQPGDVSQQREYPGLVSTTAPTSDVHWQVGLEGAVTSGLLTPKNKLGIIVDTCANDDKAFNRVAVPYLKAHHITYETVVGQCSQGQSDTGSASAQIQNAELQFRSQGVDTVFVEGVPALLFAEDAESQHWYPTYLMTFAGAAFESNVPTDQLKNFHGFGMIPSVDVDPLHQPYAWNASEKRCLDMLKSQGLTPQAYNDYFEAFTTCDSLFLYAAALKADGGQTAVGPVISALSSVIGRTLLSSTYAGSGRYVADQHGGPAVWRQWGWTSSCSCFTYIGQPHPIG